jgi:hypothetical protein
MNKMFMAPEVEPSHDPNIDVIELPSSKLQSPPALASSARGHPATHTKIMNSRTGKRGSTLRHNTSMAYTALDRQIKLSKEAKQPIKRGVLHGCN